jgi:pimeloyl-ACP methyl ester carboxylesterase
MEREVVRLGSVSLSLARTGTGRPFVFQHGLCGSADQPAEVFPPGIGYQCLTLDCRGHGQSDAGDVADWSIATFADDVAAVIAGLGVGPVVVGGISMGAAIAMRLAVRAPELVDALVIARPAWIDRAAPETLSANREIARLLAAFPPQEALARFDRSSTAIRLSREAPDNLASLRGFFSRMPVSATAAMLGAIGSDGPGISRHDIARIEKPTLVIGHRRDAIHPLEMARDIAEMVAGARFVEIPPKADDADAYRAGFRQALSQFLGDLR